MIPASLGHTGMEDCGGQNVTGEVGLGASETQDEKSALLLLIAIFEHLQCAEGSFTLHHLQHPFKVRMKCLLRL